MVAATFDDRTITTLEAELVRAAKLTKDARALQQRFASRCLAVAEAATRGDPVPCWQVILMVRRHADVVSDLSTSLHELARRMAYVSQPKK
jgi:hypothetical protein